MEQFEQNQEPVGSPKINVQLPPEQEQKKGLAIASLVLGLISMFGFCCCGINMITAPLAIIFGVIALVKKHGGTGLSIAGIITAALSLIIVLGIVFSFRDIYPYSEDIVRDYTQLVEEQDTVFPQYEKEGTLPEYLEKYTEQPFTDFFAKYDITIYDVMDALLEQYKAGTLGNINYSLPESSVSAASESVPEPA